MTWTVSDPKFAGTSVTLDAVPVDGHIGFAERLTATGTRPGDRLVWAFGSTLDGGNEPWNLDVGKQSQWFKEGFAPEECRGNLVRTLEEGIFSLTIPAANDRSARKPSTKTIAGRCSAASEIAVGDAAAWRDPVAFAGSADAGLPIIRGTTALDTASQVIWVVGLVGVSLMNADEGP